MNKHSLAQLLQTKIEKQKEINQNNHQSYHNNNNFNINTQLLKMSISLTQQFQSLPSDNLAKIYKQYPSINKKYSQLEKTLLSSIKLLGKFFDIQINNTNQTKTKNNDKKAQIINYSVQIFQELTDSIQTSVKKYQDVKSKIKKNNFQKQSQNKNKNIRPQEKYLPVKIKPADFQKHPQQQQKLNLQSIILQNCRKDCNIQKSNSLSQKVVYIDSQDSLKIMINQLYTQKSLNKQIAVDLQHSNKSFYGMTALIQISSRQKDYIIDVFPIWQIIQKYSKELNQKIFMNPYITKVMHGAQMDIRWLQRDFDIHISNLFDTFKAARLLGFPKYSLAYLLEKYINFNADKSFQLADWRIRPLSPQMLHYARCDTHYLLQIYDLLRNDLTKQAINKNLKPQQVIKQVYISSYQFTIKQAQLFTYQKIDIYQNTIYQFSKQDFIIIDHIFKKISQLAFQNDQDFYDIMSKKLLYQALRDVKNLIYAKNNVLNSNKKKSVNSRNDKINSFLQSVRKSKYQDTEKISKLIKVLKQQLQVFFSNHNNNLRETNKMDIQFEKQQLSFKKSDKNRIKNKQCHKMQTQQQPIQYLHKKQFQQQQQTLQEIKFTKINIKLQQYNTNNIKQQQFQKRRSYELPSNDQLNINKKLKIHYLPLITFISKKMNIKPKGQNQNNYQQYVLRQQEYQQMQNQKDEKEQQQQLQNQQQQLQQQQDSKQIKFTNFKHHVNYQIQDPDEGLIAKNSQPKKKRKQEKYQQRVKNQRGNIYAYFQQN